ncbi:hypothetical protein CBR_g18963 [Chara braunii]|uniref:UspA domain-containing protein n=1 Tax=Chara braunii TaxID=69332 RepID=A0A388KX45_CHABU|nr:hypothetical protein CBR_g18963 [Chara braunii]|eukprot:GBG74552.1 hypothetical protein CBR_g18963 [Chara braunii]
MHVQPNAFLGMDFPNLSDGMDFGLDMFVMEELRQGYTRQEKEGLSLINRFLEAAAEAKIPCQGEIVRGDPRDAICRHVEKDGADILVLGCRGLGGVKRAFLGSVSDHCAHHCPCPVVVVKDPHVPQGEANPMETDYERRIIVAVDQSYDAAIAFTWAVDNFFRCTDTVTVLHVLPRLLPAYTIDVSGTALGMMPVSVSEAAMARLSKNAAEAGEELLRKFAEQAKEANLNCTTRLIPGDPREVIIDECERLCATSLVIGSRGLGPIKRAILGSVSDHCAHNAPCPVIIVKPLSSKKIV